MTISLSYREKSLYASLAVEIFVYGPYFFLALRHGTGCTSCVEIFAWTTRVWDFIS